MPFSLKFLLNFKKVYAIEYFAKPGVKQLLVPHDDVFKMSQGTQLPIEKRAKISALCEAGQRFVQLQFNSINLGTSYKSICKTQSGTPERTVDKIGAK